MSILSVNFLYQSLEDFSVRIHRLLDILGFDLKPFTLDHIALRVNDPLLASSLHNQWLTLGKQLSVKEINGRDIVVIKLHKPLFLGEWDTFCVELPYPGDTVYSDQGWEHCEWVIPSTATTPEAFLDSVFARFPDLKSRWNSLQARGVTVKLSSPKGDDERVANPTVAFKANGVCIKLHPVSLETVIESEI